MPFRPQQLDTGFSAYQQKQEEPIPTQPSRKLGDIGYNVQQIGKEFQELGATMGAAFRMENDVLNVVSLMTRPSFPADPSFNVAARLKEDGLWNDYSDNFIGVDSEQEYLAVSGRIAQEEKDRATLASAGMAGFIGQMAAGMLSPTTLLPFVGGARGAKAIAIGAGMGFAGGGLQEIPLQLAQETRTMEESVSSIALSTVLGGALGGAVAFARRKPEELADLLSSGMVPEPGSSAIPTPRSAGAAARLEQAPELASAMGLEQSVGQISPVVRALTGTLDQGRWMMAQLADAGLEFKDRAVAAVGGNVENRIKTYYGPVAKVIGTLDDAFARYWFEGAPLKPLAAQRASLAGLNPNRTKLSKNEFKQEISRALQNGDRHEIPEVQEIAQMLRKEIYDPILKQAEEVGLLKTKDGETPPGDLSYLNRVYNIDLIQMRQPEFEAILANHYEQKVAADFQQAYAKLTEDTRRLELRADDFSRPEDEVKELREQFEAQLRALDEGRDEDLVELEDTITDRRSTARSLPSGSKERAAALDEARALEQEGGEALASTRAERAEIKRRLKNLRQAHSSLSSRQEAKLTKIDRAEELNFNTLTQLTRKAQSILRGLDKLSDAKLDAELSSLRNRFATIGEKFDRNEVRINEAEEAEWWAGGQGTEAQPLWTASNELPDSVAQAAAREEVMPNIAASIREIASEFDALDLPESLQKRLAGVVNEAGDLNWDKLDDFIDAAETFARNTSNPAAQRGADLLIDLQQDLMNATHRVEQVAKRIKTDYPEQLRLQREWFTSNRYNTPDSRREFLEGWYKDDQLPDYRDDMSDDEAANTRTGAGPRLGANGRYMYEQLIQENRIAEAANDATTPKAVNKLAELQARQFGLHVKLDELAERLGSAEDFDRGVAKQALQEVLDEATRRAQGIVERRAVRTARLADQAEALDPEAAAKRIVDTREDARLRRQEFMDSWRERGADDIDPASGVANFKRYAADIARQTTNKILGTYARLPGVDMILQPRGAELARTLDIDSNLLRGADGLSFLEQDVEKLMMTYVRTMAPDIELHQAFGDFAPDIELNENWRKLDDEYNARLGNEIKLMQAGTDPKTGKPKQFSQEQIDKRAKTMADEYGATRRDLEAVIGRLRHTWGVPKDPRGFGARAARVASNVNVLRMMGGVVVSSIPDLARPIMKYGLLNTFRNGYVPFVKGLANLNFTPRQLKIAGAALDVTLHSRAAQIYDIGDYMVRGSKFEKGLDAATSKIGLVALFDYWTTAMKQISGSVANARAMDAVNIVAGGAKASQRDLDEAVRFLAANGIDDDFAIRILNESRKPGGGEEVNGVWWPNTEAWTDQEAVRAYNAMLVREVDNSIITPGVERPLMTDANPYQKLLFQFKSFGMSSTTKTFLAGAQGMKQGDMAFVMGGVISLALGSLSYYTYANIVGGTVKEKMESALAKGKWELFADEAINRSGLLGVGADLQSAFAATPLAPYTTFSGERSTRRGGDNLWETVVGPTVGDLGPRAANLTYSLGKAGTTGQAGDVAWADVRRLAPFQNHFMLRQFYDMIEAAAGQLPESKE